MALLDLLGRRWALRVLWELRDEPLGFRALQERCDGMSSSVLSQRLGEMEGAAIVTADSHKRWTLTPEGRRLMKALAPLNDFSKRWTGAPG